MYKLIRLLPSGVILPSIGLGFLKGRIDPILQNNSMPHSDFRQTFYNEAIRCYHKFNKLYPNFD